jgi:ribonuclease T2
MRRTRSALLAALLALGGGARADEPGVFDYYVLALSWSPTWCALKGDADDEQCEGGFGWILHGLWPQHEEGWPSWCHASGRDPSRWETAAMADITGSAGLAWHAWEKHGTCSGLEASDYFALSREAYEAVTIPPEFRAPERRREVPAVEVERAFLAANPGLERDQVTVTCQQGHIDEIRLCLTRDLEPRRCGDDVLRDCRQRAVLEPVRQGG